MTGHYDFADFEAILGYDGGAESDHPRPWLGNRLYLRTNNGPSKTDLLYDGRGYLREGLLTVTGSSDNLQVTPAYRSDGTLMARTEVRQYTGTTIGPDGEDQALAQMSNETTQLFYFPGRPLAQFTSGPELLYLTTDHLGTPVLATDSSGIAVWAAPRGGAWSDPPAPNRVFKYVDCYDMELVDGPLPGSVAKRLLLKPLGEREAMSTDTLRQTLKRLKCCGDPAGGQESDGGSLLPEDWGAVPPFCP